MRLRSFFGWLSVWVGRAWSHDVLGSPGAAGGDRLVVFGGRVIGYPQRGDRRQE